MKRFSVFAWFGLVAVCLGQNLFAQDGAVSTSPVSIPFDQLGAAAGKQYSGDGLAVVSRRDGALLRCVFQRLNAQATAEGLWITSTVDGARGQPFRVIARTLGRSTREHLPPRGKVEAGEQVARFIRPGLTEEYSVSVDGLRQDFVLERRPEGMGSVRLELEVDGATAEAAANGVHLVLADGGRKMAYDRLKAKDARGKELPARLEVVSSNRLTVVLDDATAQYPVRIDPTFSDANWIGLGGIPGANGLVKAVAVDSAGNLYIGGQFTIVGTALANNIAKWNGSSWSALGAGMSGGDGWGPDVEALAISGTNLYAGGDFTSAGEVSANYVAQWNGSAWSPLGAGVGGVVHSLAVLGTNLYAGGLFNTAGGLTANCVAQWNGSTWSGLGAGTDGEVFALAVLGSNLYVGGVFDTVDGVSANCVAQWNGSLWSALGGGVSGGNSWGPYVAALAVMGTNLYAGGDFTTGGEVSANYIAQWNGSAWSALGSGTGDEVWALAGSGTTLYAGGLFNTAGGSSAHRIAQWNGSTWSALGTGTQGDVYALAVSGTNLYVGGDFASAGGVPANHFAQWDGNNWSCLGATGVGGLAGSRDVFALAVSGSTLYAGGGFTTAGGVLASNIAQWNGSAWSALGSGLDGQVNGLAVLGTNLYAGGHFTTAGGVSANYIAQWDGSSWSALGPGLWGNSFYGTWVSALAVSGTNLYVGGNFVRAGGVGDVGVYANCIAQWNGNTWSALGSGMDNTPNLAYVSALAVSGTNLYAGGQFTTAGGVAATNVARWNGSVWSAVGGGITDYVNTLAVSGTNLYAGGYSITAGGDLVGYAAQWDGSAWSALGSGLNGQIIALAVLGTNLYAGGSFTNAGGVSANYIAQWDGSTWSALGSGMNSYVFALAVSGNHLFAGGEFTTAGNTGSACVAEAILGGGSGNTPPVIITTNSGLGFSNGLSQFGFDVSGAAGQTLVIQASTNLSDWMPLQTNLLDSALWYFSDTSAGNFPRRFYRVQLLP